MAQQIKISAELLSPTEKKVMSAMADDLAALRAALGTLTAKLDADAKARAAGPGQAPLPKDPSNPAPQTGPDN